MGKKTFVSYSHQQGDWVLGGLVPCLRAGGAQVLIDRERFEAGKGLLGQMDATQNEADIDILVLSPSYLASTYCLHEMARAVARDPVFEQGRVIPVLRVRCPLPDAIQRPNPPYVDLTDDKDPKTWERLLDACGAELDPCSRRAGSVP